MDTFEKNLKDGTIRIENDKLIVLEEPINLKAFYELINKIGKEGVVETLATVMSAISTVHSTINLYDDSDNEELKKLISHDIRPTLCDIDSWNLNQILKAFL